MKLQPKLKMNFLAQQFSGTFTYLHTVLVFFTHSWFMDVI